MAERAQAEKLIQEKAARRAALRAEFLKEIGNPHRHGSGEGGTLFDSGVQRFMSMKVSGYDHFKPTPRTSFRGIALIVAPIVLYTAWIKIERDNMERKLRAGEISYADRKFKFI